MKKTLTLCLSFIMLLMLISPACASSVTEITTVIPSENTVTVVCLPGGAVTVDNSRYTSTNTFVLPRNASFFVAAEPNEGFILSQITADRDGYVAISGNTARIINVYDDVTITVSFSKKPLVENTDNTLPEETPPSGVRLTVPVKGEEKAISADVVLSGTSVEVLVESEKLEQMLTGDKSAQSVTVDVSSLENDITEVSLPVSAVKSISEEMGNDESTLSNLVVALPNALVSFDTAAVEAITEQCEEESLKLIVKEIPTETLSAVQKKALEDTEESSPIIVNVSLFCGEKPIKSFNGGSACVRIPYEPKENEDTSTISVWFVSEEGTLEQVKSVYSEGSVEFTVAHFSDYLIKSGVIKEAVAPPPKEEMHCFLCKLFDRNIAPWCTVIIIVAITAVVTVTVLLVRKKK